MSLIPTPTGPLPMAPTWTFAAPLTTPWTQPAACVTALPRFLQGRCDNNGCTPNAFHDTGLGDGWINVPYETALGSLTETQCQPPGYNDRVGFAFRPATGCPAGYTAAMTSPHSYATDLAILACCPSNYYLSVTTNTETYTDAQTGGVSTDTWLAGWCNSQWTLTSGQSYLGVAYGFLTESLLLNLTTTIVSTTSAVYTQSVISTGIITASTTTAIISQPVFSVVVPTQSLPASTATPQFSVFNLPFIYSILVMVGIGVGGLALLCTCYCCLRPRPRPRPVPAPEVSPYPGTTIPIPARTTYVASCRHSRSTLCSSRLSYESTCCACKDSRPASPSLTVWSRTATYCYSCQQHWRSCLASQIPVEWRAAANVEDLIDQLIEDRKCVHGIVGAACSRCPTGSKRCCACVDPRVGQLLSQEARASYYCETCRDFFRGCSPAECPAEWRLADLQCSHSRSKACSQAKQFEVTCCACKDTRKGTMPRHDRTVTYCASCSTHWNSVAVSLLPKAWGIKCEHSDQYTHCSKHKGRGQCCACLDNRSGPVGFNKKVRIATYCPPCYTHWSNTDDSACPRLWNLKCPHGRANAWEKGMRYTSGPCCCACKDTNKNMVPKASRLRGYCAACRSLWNGTPDNECPPEWQLGCRHSGMAITCLNSGPTKAKCCACNDKRTKNLPKSSRVRSYCATCEATWKAKPGSQCPSEWRLMEPRNDCKHAMALECSKAPEGVAQCCACSDGRKFVALPTRLSTFCPPCRSVWQQPNKKLPAGWLVSEKDVPLRFCKEGCLPRKPLTTYTREKPGTHSRQFDEGPRYGPPRYGRKEEPASSSRFSSNNPFRRKAPMESKQSPSVVAMSQYTVQITPIQPAREVNYEGYEEKGPQRNGPRFSVVPDTPMPQPTPASPTRHVDQKSHSAFREPPKKKGSTPSDAEKQRRKEQAGLCVGRQPKFLVPPGL